jgi:tetratricopeptide (TPR) repeat protein
MIQKAYEEGHLSDALTLMTSLEKADTKSLDDLSTVILYLQILFECEGPLSKINSLVASTLIKNPNEPRLLEFLDLSKAKTLLNSHALESGLQALGSVIQRSPSNYLALFILGTTLHWEKKDDINAIKYLEKCVAIRPQLLRAWACLGVAYKGIDNHSLATRAFQKCIALETNPQMKAYFQSQI